MQVKIGETVLVCGALSRDAEYKTVGDKQTPLCKFGLKVGERPAADGSGRRDAVWCNCTCWRKVADAAAGLCKGDVVLAVGAVQTRSYTNRDGEEAVSKELVCEGVFLMGYPAGRGMAETAPAPPAGADFEEIVSDDDLPF